MKKIFVILQAREHSSRLSGKIFRKINKIPIIEIIVKEISRSNLIDRIFIASSHNTNQKKLINILKKYNCSFYFGSENNVLSRFIFIKNRFNPDIIVRLTADNIFLNRTFLDKQISFFLKNDYDYISNLMPAYFPEGYTFEIFNSEVLDMIYKMNYFQDREHVTTSIVKKKIKLNYFNVACRKKLSDFRLTCDTINDLRYLRKISQYINFNKLMPSLKNIINIILEQNIIRRDKVTRSIHYK